MHIVFIYISVLFVFATFTLRTSAIHSAYIVFAGISLFDFSPLTIGRLECSIR